MVDDDVTSWRLHPREGVGDESIEMARAAVSIICGVVPAMHRPCG